MSILGSLWVVSVSPIMTSGYLQHHYYFVFRKDPGGFHKLLIRKLSFVPTRFYCKICMCGIFLSTVWIGCRPTKEAAYIIVAVFSFDPLHNFALLFFSSSLHLRTVYGVFQSCYGSLSKLSGFEHEKVKRPTMSKQILQRPMLLSCKVLQSIRPNLRPFM